MVGVISEIASLSVFLQQQTKFNPMSAPPIPTIPQPTTWLDTVDITNDYLTSDYHKNVTEYFHLSTNEHMAIGIYLIASGILVGLMNTLGILIFARFPRALLTPSAIPELALMACDLGVGGIHPYSGSSAIANRWLYGPAGCQLYSIAGFLFGDMQVLLVNFVAFDRFILVCKPKWGDKVRSFKSYFRILVVIFCMAMTFTVLPLLGFGSFGMIPTKIVCTLSFLNPNTNTSAYLTAKLIVICAIPYFIGVLCTLRMNRRLGQPNPPTIHFACQRGYAKITWACLLITPFSFSLYPLVAIWALASSSPMDVPRFLVPMPNIIAKLAGLFNPLVFLYANPLLWNCLRAMLGMEHDDKLIVAVEEENEAEDERRETKKQRIHQLVEAQEMLPVRDSSHHQPQRR